MIVFEVHLQAGADGQGILSEEILAETGAQMMTTAEAAAVGFEGVKQDPKVRLIAVRRSDAGWIEKALERAHDVVGYTKHEVDM